MGESKFRKQNDANYGKPRKDTLRGLIISRPFQINGNTVTSPSTALNTQELRTSLLYWDRLCLPSNNIIATRPEPDVQYLIDAGVLYAPEVILNGDMSQTLSQLPVALLMQYEKTHRGMWSLGGGENSIHIERGSSTPSAGTALYLYNAMPSPGPDVPLAEILEFRQRRRDELLSFRWHIDILTKEIESAKDSEDELKRVLSDLDIACSQLAQVCKEWQSPVHLTNLKASLNFNLPKVAGAAASTWLAGERLALPFTAKIVSSGTAALASMLDLKADVNFQKIKRDTSPFRYIYEVQKNLI
ncbi:DUF6236 family protein [Pseudomonas sp. Z13]|uniref:DUF6236 family protein n=1 Tax=Pseudomonas sp. Z13 TaxID=2983409 RepID=UPI002E7FF8AD|nr:DUF6236 family protein [Pseudomonas sp. Z13]